MNSPHHKSEKITLRLLVPYCIFWYHRLYSNYSHTANICSVSKSISSDIFEQVCLWFGGFCWVRLSSENLKVVISEIMDFEELVSNKISIFKSHNLKTYILPLIALEKLKWAQSLHRLCYKVCRKLFFW